MQCDTPPASTQRLVADPADDLTTAATIAIEACTEILEHNIYLTLDIEKTTARCTNLEAENAQLRRIIAVAQLEMHRRALQLSMLLYARHGLPVNYQ